MELWLRNVFTAWAILVAIEAWQNRHIPTAAALVPFWRFVKICLVFCDLFVFFLVVCIVFAFWKPNLKTICRFALATSKPLQNQPLFGTGFWKGSNFFKINLCDTAGCSEVLILREFSESCDRIVGCSSCFVVFNIQRSFRHFFCNLIMENQKEKTVFEYYFVAASVSHLQAKGSTWWTLIFISCTMMFYLFWNQTCNFSPCFITRLVDKPHEILWKNRALVFLVSTGCDPSNRLLHQCTFNPQESIPTETAEATGDRAPPWMRRKWVVSGRHARICHRHCGGVWVWWANNQPVGGLEGQRLRGVHFKGFPV